MLKINTKHYETFFKDTSFNEYRKDVYFSINSIFEYDIFYSLSIKNYGYKLKWFVLEK